MMLDPSGFNFHKLTSNLYLYTGIFINDFERRKLLELCPPIHPTVYADHVTLYFKPSQDDIRKFENWVDDHGNEVNIFLMHMIHDSKGQAVKVFTFSATEDGFPVNVKQQLHITISCADGVSPAYSNKLLTSDDAITRTSLGADVKPRLRGFMDICSQTDRDYLPPEVLTRRGLVTL